MSQEQQQIEALVDQIEAVDDDEEDESLGAHIRRIIDTVRKSSEYRTDVLKELNDVGKYEYLSLVFVERVLGSYLFMLNLQNVLDWTVEIGLRVPGVT